MTTDGNRFQLDGDPTELWRIGTASATASDDQCQHLFDRPDEYVTLGVHAVTVFFMGCSVCNSDPFSPDDTEIEERHVPRMQRIIEARAEREIVVVAGVFSQYAPFGLANADAVRRVTEQLHPQGNVVVNVVNGTTPKAGRVASTC